MNGGDDAAPVMKTQWKRKEDTVKYFQKDAAETDFFDLVKAGVEDLKTRTAFDGWMYKLGGRGIKQNWRRRWFVLTYDKYLYYYKTPQDATPTGVITLADYEDVTIENEKKNRFHLHNNNKTTARVYKFQAETVKDMLGWMGVINQVLKSPVLESSKLKVIRRDSKDTLPGGMRRDCRLYIRVVEARKIAVPNSYCLVSVESKQVRTQTVWKTREPMWSEDFFLDISNPDAATVNVTCWGTDKGSKDDIIGKLEVPITSLMDQRQHEQWYPLVSANAKQYVAGDVHLKLERRMPTALEDGSLQIQVVCARNLAPKGVNGKPNPYIKMIMGKKKKKTKTASKTRDPVYNEVFEFAIDHQSPPELRLSIWHKDGGRLGRVDFLGQVTVPYAQLEPNILYDVWYMVTDRMSEEDFKDEEKDHKEEEVVWSTQRKEPAIDWKSGKEIAKKDEKKISWMSASAVESDGTPAAQEAERTRREREEQERRDTAEMEKREREGNAKKSMENLLSATDVDVKSKKYLGSIRVIMKYTEDIALPLPHYQEMLDAMMAEDQDIVFALGQVTTEREDVARLLCRIFEHKGFMQAFAKTITGREIEATEDPEVIFRANSLATKSIDYYMKLVGLPYLYKTLHDVVEEMYTTKKPFEVDPYRVDNPEAVKKNMPNLIEFVNKTVNAIFDSVDEVPHKLRHIFAALQKKVIERYPSEKIQEVRYTAVSGFIFLRFFCPAILGPKLFGVMNEHPTEKTARLLTLVSKTVQNLGNLVEFEYKEPYMADVNPFIVENTGRMKVSTLLFLYAWFCSECIICRRHS